MKIEEKIEFHTAIIDEANKAIISCRKTIDEKIYMIEVSMERITDLEIEIDSIREEDEDED